MTPTNLDMKAWAAILETGFRAQTISLSARLSLTIFQFHFLRIGYVNFPFGLRTTEDLLLLQDILTTRPSFVSKLDLIRFSHPEQLYRITNKHSIETTEVEIFDLQNWTESNIQRSSRRKLRISQASGTRIRGGVCRDANFIFQSYSQTIERHMGKRRYNAAYFSSLAKIAEEEPGIIVLVAETADGKPCGFNIIAILNGTAYYLHGGFTPQYAKMRPGYFLMNAAIKFAKNSGCHSFNMMSSPENQRSLTEFKLAWGGKSCSIINHTIPLSTIGKIAISLLNIKTKFVDPLLG